MIMANLYRFIYLNLYQLIICRQERKKENNSLFPLRQEKKNNFLSFLSTIAKEVHIQGSYNKCHCVYALSGVL